MKAIVYGLVFLIMSLPVLVGCAGAPAGISAGLGQEFSLPIGQEASITGEDLIISFEDVTEDSRCPLNVTCIWEGRASSLVRFTHDGATSDMLLTEPGLTDRAVAEFADYRVTFNLKPYPGEVADITKDDYYLQLTVRER